MCEFMGKSGASYMKSTYICLRRHCKHPIHARRLPKSEICNSDAQCRKTWTHALAALERSRMSIALLCLYLPTRYHSLPIYISVSFHLDSASTSNPKANPTEPPTSHEEITHDHTTLEHLGESLLDGVGADLGGTVAISISVGSGHC